MLQDIEIKALKGESKTARLRIKPDATRVPLRNQAGFALSTLPVLKSINSKKPCVHKNYLPFVKRRNALI
jgi:hypothetical protein